MTSDIRFTDEEFSFRHNGVTYLVHTEVGNGPAQVVVDSRTDDAKAVALEAEEEPA